MMRLRNNLFAAARLVMLIVVLPGCISEYRNQPLEQYDPQGGYHLDNLELGEDNTDSTFVVLTFSGGGTRAAALAYGVLQGLRDAPIPGDSARGPQKCLLDEVDVISSVSGGSFTSMGYGLWGEGLFDGHFEESFLRYNVQGQLVLMALNPANWILHPDNCVLSAGYYDQQIFKGATYADLIQRGRRPFLVVNATDVARSEQFQFVQSNFDLLGSDLSALPVSWAVASSSAFPILLDPVRFKYYSGDAMAAAIRHHLDADTTHFHPAARLWARSLINHQAFEESGTIDIEEKDHRYLYLADGGLVDNLGLTYFFQDFSDGTIRRKINAGEIDRLVVIIVDAGTAPPNAVEHSSAAPGKLASAVEAATSGLYTNTWLEKAMAKYVFLELQPEIRHGYAQCSPAQGPPECRVQFYVADLNFHSIENPQERNRLLNMPTSFVLESEQVDELIEAGQRLVKQNPEIRRLLNDLAPGS